ncbi:MAG: response regulator [Sulfurimicrobium sp.]|nr:response regulator [Sulfurimicrobium sp.]MDO9188640.1 response regulator [Sulfurimicrobium sp.]MDP1704272.1 response regulator [Sulfurimicrobium sp.]MDP2197705.1 response regulator [Sulfurimicrobium sp.]MDP3687135.1 response regulator [Sulfurimicrobium sp.]
MDESPIFSKTARGVATLGDKKLALPREHYRLLGLVDGRSSLSELAEKSALSQEFVENVFSRLLAEGLVKQLLVSADMKGAAVSDDMTISVTELDPEEGVRAWAEAQRGARALHDQGFYAHKVRPVQGVIGRPSILSVEDDPLLAQLLALLLTREGFDVRHAADGKAMFRTLDDTVPDLVLLDVMLPDTSGFQLLEWIRKQPQLADLPVIMLTAQIGEEDVMHGLRAGADGYIFKPFSPEPLLQGIRSVLKL